MVGRGVGAVTTVVLAAHNALPSTELGGHLWVYLQYAYGLAANGCEVWWLERHHRRDGADLTERLDRYRRRLEPFGLAERIILAPRDTPGAGLVSSGREAPEAVIARADLLVDLDYRMPEEIVGAFRRSVVVDIDPGLLQYWLVDGLIDLAPHDVYVTTGETVGRPGTLVPDCGLPWRHIRPPVALEQWPVATTPSHGRFTTVSGWHGGEWVGDAEHGFDNNKRTSYLDFVDLPARVSAELELSLFLGDGDAADRRLLEAHGWRVRHSRDTVADPLSYRRYVQDSAGEFSCVKPSCLHFANAWVSDRSLCYLASGRPVVVQDTGPSRWSSGDVGLVRFRDLDEAAAAVETVRADYARHRVAARELAEAYFDARTVTARLLDLAG